MTDASLKGLEAVPVDGKGLTVGIVHTRWNPKVVNALVSGACKEIEASGGRFYTTEVPGSYEVVYAARRLIEAPPTGYNFDAVICIGCLIKGETMHFEYICEAVTQGIMHLNTSGPCPVIFGILACLNDEQAAARAGLTEDGHNHGEDWGRTAIEMGRLSKPGCFPPAE